MEDLLEKIKENDEIAYEKIFNLIYKDLYKIAIVKLENDDDANDAVQETLIKFYRNCKKIKNSQYAKTWIVKVLINECNNIYDSRKKKSNLIEKLKSNIEITLTDIEKVDDKISKEEWFKNLTEKEQEILNLYYEDDYTTNLISELLNMKESTVKSHIHRAKGKLKLTQVSTIRKQLSKFMMVILIFVVLCSGMTFAGRIIKTLRETVMMFQVEEAYAINDAIQNNYPQKVNNDFLYNNGIGIKVDSIAIDDKLLYISYLLDSNKSITDIQLDSYRICDNSNNVLSVELESNIKNIYGSDYSSEGITYDTKPVKREDGICSYSTVFQVIYNKNYPLSETINIEIDTISVVIDNKKEIINGNWKFKVDLEDKFARRDAEYYTYKVNDKIKNISAKLNDMSFELVIDFNEKINEDVLSTNNIILLDENGKEINCYSKIINAYKNRVTYICDIGKYSNSIDKLKLYVKYNYDAGKYVDIVLEKKT